MAEAWAGLHAELRVSALSCRLSPPSYLPAMSQRPERTGQEASELVCTVSTRLDGLHLALPRPAHLARVRREVALGHTAEALGAKGIGLDLAGSAAARSELMSGLGSGAVCAWVAFSLSQSRSTLFTDRQIPLQSTPCGRYLEPQDKLNTDSKRAASIAHVATSPATTWAATGEARKITEPGARHAKRTGALPVFPRSENLPPCCDPAELQGLQA